MPTKTVTITPYSCQEEFFSEPEKCWVIKGEEHPDPSRKLIWGRTADGRVISNFRRYMKRSGRPVTITYDIPRRITAMQEQKLKLEAVDKYICEDAGGRFDTEHKKCIL